MFDEFNQFSYQLECANFRIEITMEESQQLTNEDENIFTCGFDEIKSRKYISLENPWAVKLDKSLLILWVL